MIEHECPRCHREVELPFGTLCDRCRAAVERRARHLGRLIAGVTTVGVAIYVYLRMPDTQEARIVGIMGIAIWYLLTTLVVRRVVRIWQL